MKKQFIILFLFILSFSPIEAGFIVQKGQFIDKDKHAYLSCDDHYAHAMNAYDQKKFKKAIHHFSIVYSSFPETSFAKDARYYAGLCYFYTKEYDFANEEFSEYLRSSSNPDYFNEVVEHKFTIAEAFRYGAKRRFFHEKSLPKWMSDKMLAVQIYDEVILARPTHEITALALFNKGLVLKEMQDFRGSIESFQTLIRRFSKHELAPESFLEIVRVYVNQSEYESQNSDLIVLADLEIQKFKENYPKDERIENAVQNLMKIKEAYVKGLYETGNFYERKGKPSASILYYKNAIETFPETRYAEECRKRIQYLTVSK